jgi:hypothetical protein
MRRIIWRQIGQQPALRKLAASFDGSLYALDAANQLIVSQNFGLDRSWRFLQVMPAEIVNLTCAAGGIYFQTADRTLWYRNSKGGLHRAGKPWAAAALAGTEDITLDFSLLWALNDDKSLWRNFHNGADSLWQRVGQPHSAANLAAAHQILFALNGDGSLWENNAAGADGAWTLIGEATGAMEITAASQRQSAAIHLYALHADSSIWMGTLLSECQVSLTTQDAYPAENTRADWSSLAALDELGVTTDVWTIGGGALKVNTKDRLDKFLSYREDEICQKFANYLENHPHLKRDTQDLIIFDLEAPAFPPGWGRADRSSRLDEILAALETRLRIARRFLRRAKFSLHAVIAPDAQGLYNPRFLDSLNGYRRAVDFGLFDALDYLSPVLYTRWGPADGCGGKGIRRYCSLAAYNRQAIDETAALTAKPLAPMLSLVVNNPTSVEDTHRPNVQAARAQLAYLQSRSEVARLVYWTAPSPKNQKGYYVRPAEILHFFRELDVCGK